MFLWIYLNPIPTVVTRVFYLERELFNVNSSVILIFKLSLALKLYNSMGYTMENKFYNITHTAFYFRNSIICICKHTLNSITLPKFLHFFYNDYNLHIMWYILLCDRIWQVFVWEYALCVYMCPNCTHQLPTVSYHTFSILMMLGWITWLNAVILINLKTMIIVTMISVFHPTY